MTEFEKFKVSNFFDIQKVRGINKSGLTKPTKEHAYDYITRTSKNNGIEEITGLVANRELNEPGTYSLGLLQMTFFLRDRPWYGGQFVRKIVPKVELNRDQMLYFLGVLQALSPMLKDILVRNVDKIFLNTDIELPVTPSGDPDFTHMTRYIQDLEAQRIQDLDAYLKVSGLDNTELTDQEKAVLTKKVEWKKFVLGKLFDIQKIRGVNKSGLTNPSNGNNYDYITRTSQNNGIESHSGLVANRELNENGTYSLGLLQMTFFYRERPWYAGQFVRKIVPKINLTREQALYFLSVFNALRPKLLSVLVRNVDNVFSAQEIELPVTSTGTIDFAYMQDYITALEKLNIKDVVAYKDKVIATTKQIVSQQS